jgi:hypothetical protein
MLVRFFALIFIWATSVFAASIVVEDAYVRAVPPNLKNSAAFLKISNNTNEEIFLLKASSPVAQKVELHEHIMDQGMMKMQEVEKIAIASQSTTMLKPGGYHIMLIGLKKPLLVGESIPLELHYSNGDIMQFDAIPIKSVMMGMKKH